MVLQGILQVTLLVTLHFSNLDCWSAKRVKCTWSVKAPLEVLQQSEVASLFLHLLYHIISEFVTVMDQPLNQWKFKLSHTPQKWASSKFLWSHFISISLEGLHKYFWEFTVPGWCPVDKKHVIHWMVQQEFKLRLHKDAGHAQSFPLVASQCLSKLYMKLDCKHLLIMRLSGEASFEAKDKVI